jgi:CheY-like chemotaxis protein
VIIDWTGFMRSIFEKKDRQRVLIVDSDMAAAAGLVALVAESGSDCEVVSACSGFEGIKKIETGVVNIVLAAEKLVDMTGTTFINILQSLKKSKKKEPVCLLMAENRKRIQTAEIDRAASFDVIRSPVDPDELAYALDRAMDWDGLNWKIVFNEVIWKVLLGLVPVAVVVGGLLGAL